MFDFNDWILGRHLTREAYAACMHEGRECEGSAGLQYLFTYLSELHKAYALWSAECSLSDDEQEIANQRLTGIAKLKDLVCMAATQPQPEEKLGALGAGLYINSTFSELWHQLLCLNPQGGFGYAQWIPLSDVNTWELMQEYRRLRQLFAHNQRAAALQRKQARRERAVQPPEEPLESPSSSSGEYALLSSMSSADSYVTNNSAEFVSFGQTDVE